MTQERSKKENLKILWFFFKPFKFHMLVVLVSMMTASLMEACNLAAIYPIINYGLKTKDTSTLMRYFEYIINIFGRDNLFLSSCLFLIVITIVAISCKLFYHFSAFSLVRKIISHNQKDIFNKLTRADYDFFIKSQQGRLVYVGTVANQGVVSNTFYSIRIINNIITCVCITTVLLILSWRATLMIMAIGLLYVLFVRKIITKFVNESSRSLVEEDRNKNVILNEFITGIKSIKVFQSLKFWGNKYHNAVDKSALCNFKVMFGRSLPDSFIKLSFFSIIALGGILLSLRYSNNIMAMLPLLGTFVAVASRLAPYINLVGADIMALFRYMPDTKLVYNFLHEEMEHINEGSNTVESFKDEITFDNVSFKHRGMSDNLLKDVSFSVKNNQITAVVGPSGAGKSTIINLLFRLYDVDQGKILIDGKNIQDFTYDSYLSKFGYVGQETFIFYGTIEKNIKFGLSDCSKDDIIDAAKLANAHEFIINSEKGYDTIVGDQGMKLSGGQRQRIAIARAILRKPQILVLDEATSSLDNISEKKVQEAVYNIAKQTTVLVIAHRLSTVMNADKIIVLENGEVVEQGTHEDLLKQRQRYFNLYSI